MVGCVLKAREETTISDKIANLEPLNYVLEQQHT